MRWGVIRSTSTLSSPLPCIALHAINGVVGGAAPPLFIPTTIHPVWVSVDSNRGQNVNIACSFWYDLDALPDA